MTRMSVPPSNRCVAKLCRSVCGPTRLVISALCAAANVAVVFDYSRYMNTLVSIDPEAKLAVVQPGIVLVRVREAAEVYHLTYAPDPATHSRCTLGGMIGNNSCGVHGLLGGKVVDNVETLDIVLYDGTRMTVGRTSPEELEAKIAAGGREGGEFARPIRLHLKQGRKAARIGASRQLLGGEAEAPLPGGKVLQCRLERRSVEIRP